MNNTKKDAPGVLFVWQNFKFSFIDPMDASVGRLALKPPGNFATQNYHVILSKAKDLAAKGRHAFPFGEGGKNL